MRRILTDKNLPKYLDDISDSDSDIDNKNDLNNYDNNINPIDQTNKSKYDSINDNDYKQQKSLNSNEELILSYNPNSTTSNNKCLIETDH